MSDLYSAIDIGTNSVRHAIGEERGGILVVTEKKLITTRLGEGTADTDELGEEPMERTIRAIDQFVKEAQSRETRLLGIYATSAVREASNKERFLEKAKKHGLDIEVLSGEKESTIAFRGVTGNRSGCFAVADIGGGSTEISYGRDGVLSAASSVRIGAVRMTQRFADENGVVSPENQAALLEYAVNAFCKMTETLPEDALMYGVGGTFTTLASMKIKMRDYDPERIQDAVLTFDDVHALRAELCGLNNETKLGLPGLMPKRADIIACASLIAEAVLISSKRKTIRVSERDGLDGYMNYKLSLIAGS
ncbi:MAG: hypothetical protein IJJ34_09925 [Clostridia bacterium]|nr:hypothetical protein [Clostridia bacterium]